VASRLTYTLDCCDGEQLSAFYAGALDYSCRGRFGQYWPLQSRESPDEPWLVLQQVAEAKHGKNRMHLDLHIDGGDLNAEVSRLEALGAQRLSKEPVEMGDHSWFVTADPEGNEFCVVRRPG
jgi:predicted enzyme related to lactoylglutathione lyase